LVELKSLTTTHASLTKGESSHPFTESATFADDVKSTYSFQSGWHFIDQPYLD
jgi:S1/P1 Nuclease